MPKDDLTVQEVAARLNAAPSTVNAWLRKGLFPGAYKAGVRLWLIPEGDLAGFERPRMGKPRQRKSGESESIVIQPQAGNVVAIKLQRRGEDA